MKNLLFRCDPCQRTETRSVEDKRPRGGYVQSCSHCDAKMYVQPFGKEPKDRRAHNQNAALEKAFVDGELPEVNRRAETV
jgi:hypothetical protein